MGSNLVDALDSALGPLGSQTGAGEDAVIRRVVGEGNNAQNSDVGFRAKFNQVPPEKLGPGISQADFEVILSPTYLQRGGWPGGSTSPAINPNAPWAPQVNDKVFRKATGRWHNVKAPPILKAVAGEIARIELIVAG